MGNRLTVTADWYTRLNDTSPTMTATLKDGAGVAVNVTGATVTLEAYGPGADISLSATLSDPANGVVTATPTFIQAGTYYARFKVVFSGGQIQTFPSDSDLEVEVRGPA